MECSEYKRERTKNFSFFLKYLFKSQKMISCLYFFLLSLMTPESTFVGNSKGPQRSAAPGAYFDSAPRHQAAGATRPDSTAVQSFASTARRRRRKFRPLQSAQARILLHECAPAALFSLLPPSFAGAVVAASPCSPAVAAALVFLFRQYCVEKHKLCFCYAFLRAANK